MMQSFKTTYSPSDGNLIKFFFLGPKNDWRKSLDNDIQKNIEVAFKNEMIQLGYL